MSEETIAHAAASNVGVINPYALAELVRGEAVDWEEVDARDVFEEVFERPYEELFDPQFGSPLYPGLELTDDLTLERRPVSDIYLDLDLDEDESFERVPDPDLSNVRTLADLAERMDVRDLGRFEITDPTVKTPESISLVLKRPQAERGGFALQPFRKEIIESIVYFEGLQEEGWTPTGAEWSDPGDFFHEAAEFFDPIQGAVANCYLIAAMGAVAWAKPYSVKHQSRATGATQQEFVDMIEFHENDGSTMPVEVSESVPLKNGNLMYARSGEQGEIWPAIVEKAYAKWTTSAGSDKPNITSTAYGDPVHATKQLVGGSKSYVGTSGTSATDLWNTVRANSRSYKTFNPGTAWTYGSAAAAPDSINYANANIVANHAYTVLGWDYDSGTRYIVLRNPWGQTEPSIGRMNGVWTPYDESFWRNLNLPANTDVSTRGSFAIDASTFKKYFRGLGFVS